MSEKKICNIDQKGTDKLQQRESRILKLTECQEREEDRAVSVCQSFEEVFVDYTRDLSESSKECSYDDEDNIDVEYIPEENLSSLKLVA